MTSFQSGYETNYSSISPFQLFLHLTSYQELDYASNLDWDTLQNYKEKNINPFKLLSEKSSIPIPVKNTISVLDIIKSDKKFSRFLDLARTAQLFPLLDNTVGSLGVNSEKITLFLPINDSFDLIVQALNLFRPYLTPKDIVKNHIIQIPLYFQEMKNRKLRLYPMYEQEKNNSLSYILDGKNQIIVNQRTMDISITPIFNTCRILDYIETNNGIVYVIDTPIVPYIT